MKINLTFISIILLVFALFACFERQEAIGFSETENPPAYQESLVYVAEIEGEIKAGTVQYIERVIKTGEENNASYIVIKLDTPGGLLDSTRKITDLMLESKTEIIVFVHKKGGWAYSAGVFIILASDFTFARPDSSIGAAEPKAITGESIEDDDKIKQAMVSWIKNLALHKERNPEIAEKIITENLVLSGTEAKEKGLIEETAETLEQVFEHLNLQNPEIRIISPNVFEKVFDFLSHPYLVSLFLSLGVLGLVFAFRTGEFEISGVLAIILLFIGLWGLGIINFNVLGIVLTALGVLLIAIEIFGEPGFGAFGVLGIIALALGIINFGAEPLLAPKMFDFATLFTAGVLFAFVILFIIIGKGIAKTYKTKPSTGPESLIGAKAEVIKALNPRGMVKIKGETWSAQEINEKEVPEKTRVEIERVEGNTLIVKTISKRSI